MKIIIYSQNIWGVGHFFRSLEICKALSQHDVILILGGDRVDIPLPNHVRAVRLPSIMTDREYSKLFTTEPGMSFEQAKQARKDLLCNLLADKAPDVFLVEFYPFGRNAFRFELDPVFEGIRRKDLPPCRVVCSLRDILVEKKNPHLYESRVIRKLNRYFDALLVHADPKVLKLDETFSRTQDITIPIEYTGYVAQKPSSNARAAFRQQNGFGGDDTLIVASAGGGKAGAALLESTILAFRGLDFQNNAQLHVFTGPYLSHAEYERIQSLTDKNVQVSRFSSNFLSHLAAADLSISMAGYNTSMNILATKVSALVWPFSHDREQGMRADQLARSGALRILKNEDLEPNRLGAIIKQTLSKKPQCSFTIDLDGAQKSARFLEKSVRF